MTPSPEIRNLTRLILAGGANAEIAKAILEGRPELWEGVAGQFEEPTKGYLYDPELDNQFDVKKPSTWHRLKCGYCQYYDAEMQWIGSNGDYYWSFKCSKGNDIKNGPCTKFKDSRLIF